MRVLPLLVAIAIASVAAMPTVVEFEVEDSIYLEDIIKTKEDLIDFITEGSTEPVKLKSFSYTDCGGPNRMVHINNVDISPDPLVFPGPLNVETSFQIMNALTAPIVGDLLIEKKILGKFVKVPCVDNIGSCHYPDTCELLDQIPTCPDPIVRIGIDCRCPLKAGMFTFPKTEFDVDIGILPKGDYHIRGNVTVTGKEAACLDLMLTFG